VKLQRSGYVAGIALTATLALTACGSDNEAPRRSIRKLRQAAA
jgi:phosphate transport system substrate-binding protein